VLNTGPLHGLANQEVLSGLNQSQKFSEGKEVNAETITSFVGHAQKVIPVTVTLSLTRPIPGTCANEFALKHMPERRTLPGR
jgi:hypothetical protein